ncbi:hypothetical protein [Cellulomonas sp. S1-8]|uniref:hypothetical protein n=1 Tax=Cellulomonas sp. S1-8 TaxID=2904790 RepID=UPI002243E552|nr:hypothetical protein [Cellulomonas sp. S1-8]UZN01510.1 hypothetical protein OKX07_10310 [Cellulomonas sp. S1-8]
MRSASSRAVLAACVVVVLAGCGAQADDAADASTSPAAVPSSAAPDSSPSEPAPATRADVGADVLLAPDAWAPVSAPRTETGDVTAWRLPESCAVGSPDAATAMLTAAHGDGLVEMPVGVQQVAVFPDADSAVAELDRVVAALTVCGADGATAPTRYLLEPVAVGAQGTGLVTDYYGSSAQGDLDGAMGSYLALTRRGTAVTLVSHEGGESTVGTARDRVAPLLDAAWRLLCPYDAAGC